MIEEGGNPGLVVITILITECVAVWFSYAENQTKNEEKSKIFLKRI